MKNSTARGGGGGGGHNDRHEFCISAVKGEDGQTCS